MVGHVDANTYKPFKRIDTSVTKSILDQLDNISQEDEERKFPLPAIFILLTIYKSTHWSRWGPYQVSLLYVLT